MSELQVRNHEITPTQREQYARHIRFKASLAEKAKALSEARKEVSPESFPAETDPPNCFPLAGEIIEVVAKHFRVTPHDIVSNRRTGDIVPPRQIAMYLAKELTPYSYPTIGRKFQRDHTVIIYAVNKIEVQRHQDEKLDRDLNTLTAKVRQAVRERRT